MLLKSMELPLAKGTAGNEYGRLHSYGVGGELNDVADDVDENSGVGALRQACRAASDDESDGRVAVIASEDKR